MIPALLPANETDRLQLLQNLDLLETPPDPMLDAMVASAAAIADCPMAMLTLVDAKRMWVKAKAGTVLTQAPRDIAFCAWTILGDELFEVNDIAADRRFAGHPLLSAPVPVRYYAGMPIGVDGCAVGALCVSDVRERHLDPRARQALVQLARSVSSWMAQRLRHLESSVSVGEALLRPWSAMEVSCNAGGGFHLSLRPH